jgi:hypothetical protein
MNRSLQTIDDKNEFVLESRKNSTRRDWQASDLTKNGRSHEVRGIHANRRPIACGSIRDLTRLHQHLSKFGNNRIVVAELIPIIAR